MEIDVGAHIADVLLEREKVTLPGLGEFKTQYKEATSEKVHGKLMPPAKELYFHINAAAADGYLVKHIKEKHTLSYADAQKIVSSYINEVKTSIDNKEIVAFPNVGRLYKDYEQNIKFLPDKENFNKSAFGLPAVELLPTIKEPIKKQEPILPKIDEEAITNNISNWFQKNIIAIAAVSLTVILTAGYLIFFPNSRSDSGLIINQPPGLANGNRPEQTLHQKKQLEAPQIGFNKIQEAEPEKPDNTELTPLEAIEQVIPKPKKFTAVFSVGIFSNTLNADRMAITLRKEGFKPGTKKSGKNTLVILEMGYDDESEIEEITAELKRKIHSEDVVLLEKKSNEL